VKDDVSDGVEGARRQGFGGRDEIAGGVVHQAGEAAAFPKLLHHVIDRLGDADVHLEGVDAPIGIGLTPGRGGFVQHRLAAPADCEIGAE
jgi:hypothetical protein